MQISPNLSQVCETCRHKQTITKRSLGHKLTVEFQNQIKKLKQPRNLETPSLNIYQFIKDKQKSQPIETLCEIIQQAESRLPTHNTKTRTECHEIISHHSEEETSPRLDFQAPVKPLFRLPAKDVKSSAFYKMKQMRSNRSKDNKSARSSKIQIGPIFNQVSKYVQTVRPQTTGFNQVELTNFRNARLLTSKSEFLLRPPTSPKFNEVQSLLKRKY